MMRRLRRGEKREIEIARHPPPLCGYEIVGEIEENGRSGHVAQVILSSFPKRTPPGLPLV
jgi:hypothetical protein